jgi:hypothetical protein
MSWQPVAAGEISEEVESPPNGNTLLPPPVPAGGDVPAAEELDTWNWERHELSWSLATKLGFALAEGKVEHASKVIVAEWSRSRTVARPEGKARYGVAARLIVRVKNLGADANLNLPFIAAEAQFGRLEASASVRVEGYVGPEPAESFSAFESFNVESYVRLNDAFTKLTSLIGSNAAAIRPTQLWTWVEPQSAVPDVSDRLAGAVGTTYALAQIAGGVTLQQAVAGYQDTTDDAAHAAIRDTYAALVDGPSDGQPQDEACDEAKRMLDGYRLKASWF